MILIEAIFIEVGKGGVDMAISNVSLNTNIQNMPTSAISTSEKECENLQNQINGKEQLLKRLSTDPEKTSEEKARERQEVQKQIQELNRKLRLLQMEKEEEAQKAEKEKEQKVQEEEQVKTKEKEKAQKRTDGMEEETPQLENLQKMLASDSNIHQNRIQEKVAARQEAKMKVLETEIKSDKLYGTDTTTKQEELSELRKQKNFEIEPKEPEQKTPDYVMASGAKIIIR